MTRSQKAFDGAKKFGDLRGRLVQPPAPGPPVNAQHVHIAGQSNAVGYADPDFLDDRTLITAFPSVQMNQLIGVGDPFVAEFTITTQDLAPYDPSGSGPGMGCELALGHALFEQGRTPSISKFGVRGSEIGLWLPSADNYWPLWIAYLDARVIEFGQLGILVWDQGESDGATSAQAEAYAENLTTLITALRARYGPFTVVVRQMGPGIDVAYAHIARVRAEQVYYCSTDQNSILINADDITLSGDALHYDANQISAIGYRMADEIVARLGPVASAFTGPGPEYFGAMPGVTGAGALQPQELIVPSVPGFFDILVVASGLAAEASPPALTDRCGFVYIDRKVSTYAGLTQYLSMWYRRRTARTMGDPIVADNNNFNAAKIFTFRQPTTMVGTPIDASAFSANDTYGTAHSITGLTTTGANRLVALFVAAYGGLTRTFSGWTNAALSSITERQDNGYLIPATSDYEMIACVTGEKAVAGVIGATSATSSGDVVAAYAALAFKP